MILLIAITTVGVIAAQSAQGTTLGNESGTIENQPEVGVPFIIHLKYVNGTVPVASKLNYIVRFGYNEPFKISLVNKGTFDAAMVLNNTAAQFQSSSISKLQDKTGLVLFSFQNGLAEKHRILKLTHKVTLGVPTLLRITGNPLNSLLPSLGKSTLNLLLPSPPLNLLLPGPTRTLSASLQTGPLSASLGDLELYLSIIKEAAEAAKPVLDLAKEAYNATTPCASINGKYVEKSTSSLATIVQYLVGVTNCSAHPELMSISAVVPQGITPSLETARFDSEAHSVKNLNMSVIIPVNYLPGIYIFKIDGKVLFNFFGTPYVFSETTGNTSPPFILTR